MATNTTNYNLVKPLETELYDVNIVNSNSDIIDTTLFNKVDKVTGKSLVSDTAITDLTDGGDTTLHIHDTRYYTETEVNTLFSNKSDVYLRSDLKVKKVLLQKLTDIKSILNDNLIAFYPLNDFEQTVAKDYSGSNTHGVFSATGLTHKISPFDDLYSAIKVNGGGNVNILSTALASKFNGNTGAFFLDICCETLSDWIDATTRTIANFYVNDQNSIVVRKANGKITVIHKGSNVSKSVDFTSQSTAAIGTNPTKPLHLLFTWTSTALDIYANGVKLKTISTLSSFVGIPTIMTIGTFTSGSTSGGFVGYIANCGLVNRYVEEHEARSIFNAMNYKGLSMSIIGDSISNDNTDWPVYFLNNQSEYTFILSKAVAGNSIVSHMTTQTTEVLKDNYDTVIMLMGTNDDNAGDMTVIRTTIETNFDRIKTKYQNAKIYVINVLPVWTNTTGTTVVDKSNIRTAIQTACTNKGVTCWNSFSEQWILPSDTIDGLHPNSGGSLKIALKVKEKLGI